MKEKYAGLPPGICEKSFEDPDSHLISPQGNRLIYCVHNQAAATTVRIGWATFWPITPDQMDKLILETVKQDKAAYQDLFNLEKAEH